MEFDFIHGVDCAHSCARASLSLTFFDHASLMGMWAPLLLVCAVYFAYRLLRRASGRTSPSRPEDLLHHHLQWIERERSILADALHDELLSQLQVIRMGSENGVEPQRIQDGIQQAMRVARRISHTLTPPLLEDMHLGHLLEHYLSDMEEDLLVTVNWSTSEPAELPSVLKIQVFRIVQELLRAAESRTSVDITICHGARGLVLSLQLQGQLHPTEEWRNLLTARVDFLQAHYTLRRVSEDGCHLVLCVPHQAL